MNLERYWVEGIDGDRYPIGCPVCDLPQLRKEFAGLIKAIARVEVDSINAHCDRILSLNGIFDWVKPHDIPLLCLGELPLLAAINGILPLPQIESSKRIDWFWGCDRKRHFIKPFSVAKAPKVARCFEDLQEEIKQYCQVYQVNFLPQLFLNCRNIRAIAIEILDLADILLDSIDMILLCDLVFSNGDRPPVLAEMLMPTEAPKPKQGIEYLPPLEIKQEEQHLHLVGILISQGISCSDAIKLVENESESAIATLLKGLNPAIAEKERNEKSKESIASWLGI